MKSVIAGYSVYKGPPLDSVDVRMS